MILDNYLSYNNKVLFSVIISGLWIYFRTNSCYVLIPRNHISSVFIVTVWTFLNYYEPLFLPIGLCILFIYSIIHTPTINNK